MARRATSSATRRPSTSSRKISDEGEAPGAGLIFVSVVQAAAALLWGWAVLLAATDRRVAIKLKPAPEAPSERSTLVDRNQGDLVSIVVPARNEASNIGAWMDCALAQEGVAAEIIIADDSSDDETAAIGYARAQRDPRVRVLQCPPPPSGWVGKNWAANLGAAAASGEWLLFSDADMRMRASTVSAAVAAAKELGADVLSLTALLECGTVEELVVLPAIAALIGTGYPLCMIHSDRVPVALVWGGFMLARQSAYWRIGGHAAVRGEIAEDRALAERAKAFGFRIRLLDGGDFVRVRMYRGFREMWVGWGKNFFEGVRRSPLLAALFVAGSIITTMMPLGSLLYIIAVRARRGLRPVERRLAAFAALCVLGAVALRLLRDPPIRADSRSALLTPLAGAFIAAVMTASAWRGIRGKGQVWKGRTILS